MEFIALQDTPVYTWVILPLLIVLARIIDVSIGTLRIIFIAKRKMIVAPVLGFFEVLIWLLAIQQIFKNLNADVTKRIYPGMGHGINKDEINFINSVIAQTQKYKISVNEI